MNLWDILWSAPPTEDEKKGKEKGLGAPDITITSNSDTELSEAANQTNGLKRKDRPFPTESTNPAAIPLPPTPGLPSTTPAPVGSPDITKVKKRKKRRVQESKVFLLKAPGVKRTESGKKTRMAAADVSKHFASISIDKGVTDPDDFQERLAEVVRSTEVDDEGYILSTNAISSFSLVSMDSSQARVADFSLPLHPHKVITVFFPPSTYNARPRPHSRSSSISTTSTSSSSNVANSSTRQKSPKKSTPKMLTMTSPGSKTRTFIYDGYNYRWAVEEGHGRVLRRYAASTAADSADPLEGGGGPVDGEVCARYAGVSAALGNGSKNGSSKKSKAHKGTGMVLLVDPSRCDERVAITTLFVCLRKEEGLRGLLAGIIR